MVLKEEMSLNPNWNFHSFSKLFYDACCIFWHWSAAALCWAVTLWRRQQSHSTVTPTLWNVCWHESRIYYLNWICHLPLNILLQLLNILISTFVQMKWGGTLLSDSNVFKWLLRIFFPMQRNYTFSFRKRDFEFIYKSPKVSKVKNDSFQKC